MFIGCCGLTLSRFPLRNHFVCKKKSLVCTTINSRVYGMCTRRELNPRNEFVGPRGLLVKYLRDWMVVNRCRFVRLTINTTSRTAVCVYLCSSHWTVICYFYRSTSSAPSLVPVLILLHRHRDQFISYLKYIHNTSTVVTVIHNMNS